MGTLFSDFVDNISLPQEVISDVSKKYADITSALNSGIRDITSTTANTLQVGSYGRKTAIRGVSDFDMIYIISLEIKHDFNGSNPQRNLLTYVKDILSSSYPRTDIYVDRQIISVPFTTYKIEILPSFPNDDGSFTHADTYHGGKWCRTNPKEEIDTFNEMATKSGPCFRHLCKMIRAWKNKIGIALSGYLIDTLVYNFFKIYSSYYNTTSSDYPRLCHDFFYFLSQQPAKEYYLAPGSKSKVQVEVLFQEKASQAVNNTKLALECKDKASASVNWKRIFGRPFPSVSVAMESHTIASWSHTEEFIEDKFFVDIRYHISIDCQVSQKGFRLNFLSKMLQNNIPLLARKDLEFSVKECSVPLPYKLYWKILNRGYEAQCRDQIRGQILPDDGSEKRKERTKFRGDHYAECYAIKNNIVVARAMILVPIKSNYEEDELE
jgi:hypothetical protein